MFTSEHGEVPSEVTELERGNLLRSEQVSLRSESFNGQKSPLNLGEKSPKLGDPLRSEQIPKSVNGDFSSFIGRPQKLRTDFLRGERE